MRTFRMRGASIGALIIATMALASSAQAADNELLGQINSLSVAGEKPVGYDRDLFGRYDRQALLDKNHADWSACDGYYSLADNKCYTNASDVDVDHIVALVEAWQSGASFWSKAEREEFGGYAANLWLMTGNVKQSKGDGDAAEWLPPYKPAVCDYVKTYVAVKAEWNLSVDEAEKAALIDAAKGCGASTEPTAGPTTGPTTGPPTAPVAPGTDGSDDGSELPVTGAGVARIASAAAVLLATGAGLLLMVRRRRVNSTT